MSTSSATIPVCHLTSSDLCSSTGVQIFMINGLNTCEFCLADFVERVADGKLTYPAEINWMPFDPNDFSDILDPRILEIYVSRELEHTSHYLHRVHCACERFIGVKIAPPASPNISIIGQCLSCEEAACMVCATQLDKDLKVSKALDHDCKKKLEDMEKQRLEFVNGPDRGKGYQICPFCKRIGYLPNACHHIFCECGKEFCFRCGKPAKERSGHWGKQRCQCPQYPEDDQPEEDQVAATNDPTIIEAYGGNARGWPGIAAYLIGDPVWGSELQEIAAEAERARFDRHFQANAHAAQGQHLPPQEQTPEHDAHIRRVFDVLGGANEVGDQAGVPVHELVEHHTEAAGRMVERYRARWPRDEIPILGDPDYDEWRAWHLAFQMHMATMEQQRTQRQRDMPERVGGVEGDEDEGGLNAAMKDLEQPVDQPAGAVPEPAGHYRIDENGNRVYGQQPAPAVRNPRPRRRRADEYYYTFLGAGRGGGRRDNDEDDFANEG